MLGLVAARDALSDAGYGEQSSKFTKSLKEKTGVLLGVGGGQKLITPLTSRLQYPIWEKALRSSGIAEEDIPPIVDKMKKAYVGWNENSFPGFLGNVISGRIANRFDLGGINSVVDAACAASLSAIKMALSELIEGHCDMMLTGGVDTDNSPFMYMSFSKTPAFSKSGNISPFGNQADGMLIGEGLGMLVLKRLEDAERDGDQIYALIKGVGSSSDGRFKSVYAPRSSGQALAMNRAYEDAGYPASTVGLIEAHGTGTEAGDPTEFTSMEMVFGANNDRKQHIALGSVKSQIGHTKAAAGAAGMVKAVLALHHKVLPPTINVEHPNIKFNIEDSPLYINTESRPWIRNGHPRRASVSAFGFGGINVHLALEEYQGTHLEDFRLHQPYKSILLQAETPEDLQALCRATLKKLQEENNASFYRDLVQSSESIIPSEKDARLGFVVTDIENCKELLEISLEKLVVKDKAWSHHRGIHFRPHGVNTDTHKIVALFSGQGSQYVGMGKEMANAFPTVREAFEKADKLFSDSNEQLLSKTVFPIPSFTDKQKKHQEEKLTQTQYAQPAIGALSMGQYQILRDSGFEPDFTAGHSFGELTALWAAGVYDDETYLALAKARGAAMATKDEHIKPSTMLAVKGPAEKVEKEIGNIEGVGIANFNSANQVVLGGGSDAVQQAEKQLSSLGFSVFQLPVSAAFHTKFVEHAQKPFSTFLSKQKFTRPRIPVYSNTSGKPYPKNLNSLKSILKQHMQSPVLFRTQIENIHQAGGRIFVEFGPKGVLTNLVTDILGDKEYVAVALNPRARQDSDLQFRQAVVQLRVLGLPLANIDPHKRELSIPKVSAKMNMKLSGNNYVSPSTRKAYQDELNNGFSISPGPTKIVEKVVEVQKPAQTANLVAGINKNEEETMNKDVLQLLQTALQTFQANQARSLDLFEKVMSDQNQQAQQILQLLSQQISGHTLPPVPYQGRTASIPSTTDAGHTLPTKPVSEYPDERAPKKTGPSTSTTPPSKQVTPEITTQTKNGRELSGLETILLQVVSEKTGYPAEMLELNMDMEADLGIDSIKRVEIFGALTQQYPEMSDIDPNDLTELRTLAEIVTHVTKKGGSYIPNVATQETSTVPTNNTSPAAAPMSEDLSSLEEILLSVVSEKTGYPAEMLELNMDMEADLGIDSIKRVEIFGALTQQYPEMSNIDPNELTELRTLAEIVAYVTETGKKKVKPVH